MLEVDCRLCKETFLKKTYFTAHYLDINIIVTGIYTHDQREMLKLKLLTTDLNQDEPRPRNDSWEADRQEG